jgi:hypothetical protein
MHEIINSIASSNDGGSIGVVLIDGKMLFQVTISISVSSQHQLEQFGNFGTGSVKQCLQLTTDYA